MTLPTRRIKTQKKIVLKNIQRRVVPKRDPKAEALLAARKWLEQMSDKIESPRRVMRFYPYLLMRAFAGDSGARPLTSAVTDPSCIDLWYAEPDTAFPNFVNGACVGDKLSIKAHVWNLGRAPVISGTIGFYWSTVKTPNSKDLKLISQQYFDLPSRTSLQCHSLFDCSASLFVPDNVSELYLFAQASCFGDTAKSWDYRSDRHVVCRRIPILPDQVLIVFNALPNGTPITTDKILSGNEFAEKGLLISPVSDSSSRVLNVCINPQCQYGQFHTNEPTLTTCYPNNPNQGTSFPVKFTFTAPVKSVAIEFVGSDFPYNLKVWKTNNASSSNPDASVVQRAPLPGGKAIISYASTRRDIDHVTFGYNGVATRVTKIAFKRK